MTKLDVNHGGFWRVLYVLLLGQLASFSLAFMSFNSSLSANLGVNAPFTLAFFSYLAVTSVFGSILLYRRQKLHVSSHGNLIRICEASLSFQNDLYFFISWYWYVLLAVADVQGGYLVNKAYQFSSITSVTILDCATVVWVIILTWLFLGTKYSLWQFLGAALCVTGLCLVLLSDSEVGGGGGSNPILGDILVIAGTCCFALTNVSEEFCVKKVGRIEVITMLGLFGMLVSLIEIVFSYSEEEEHVSVFHNHPLVNRDVSFMFCSFAPLVLQASGATLFNLSLLTADMWAVAIRVLLYRQKVDRLYYVSFLLVGIGLFIYTKMEKHTNELPELENGETDQPYQQLPAESVHV
ncbi:solute carrier family 35 member F2-like [Cynara cardunculus var. scolymus]|uniref:solute carrier family 35 member F2-like n=1 Tax=Cynara cardunculus var. scolymus TaxID=59895 RepID=UPI000D62FB3C|nr:solute carrier family 35 member F2-like [Cynara cardunculus var. scolymus]